MTTMKIQITPEMRIRLMHAETIEIDVPDTQAEFVGSLRQQLLTQDNRWTADPFYVVFSKREIVAREGYDFDRIVWWHDEGSHEASERTSKRRAENKRDRDWAEVRAGICLMNMTKWKVAA
jgi:hypothetical protein